MFISNLTGTTTIFDNGLPKGRLWIKACYVKTKGSLGKFTPITLKCNRPEGVSDPFSIR